MQLAVIDLCCLAHIVFGLSLDSSDQRKAIRDGLSKQRHLTVRARNHAKQYEETYTLENTYFRELQNYEVSAKKADESKYPWIALVAHSPNSVYPYLCTAACIQPKIFVTTANCLVSLKLPYVSVQYRQTFFGAKAMLISSDTSKQLFDDTGIIVVKDNPKFRKTWSQINPIKITRKDSPPNNKFRWFEPLEDLDKQQKVVGHATKKHLSKLKTPDISYDLVELPVYVGIDLCTEILSIDGESYHVPCYSACTPDEMEEENPKCKKYLGSEGAAVINTTSGELIGVATWGMYSKHRGFELPICDVDMNILCVDSSTPGSSGDSD